MRLLTHENDVFLMDCLPQNSRPPNEVAEMLEKAGDDSNDYTRYCVLDCSDPQHMDFYFEPLVFWESYEASAVCIETGVFRHSEWDSGRFQKSEWVPEHTLMMPMDWSVLIGDPTSGVLELIPLKEHNDRDFKTPVFNPIDDLAVLPSSYVDIRCRRTVQTAPWSFPKMAPGHMLPVPLEKRKGSPCMLLAGEIGKIPTTFHVSEILP